MRQSKFFMPTLKEAPSDAVAKSHQLMLRGGYIRQVTAGVYAYLPLGYRVLRKAENIIEEEMNNINVPEMIMPHLLPATLWQESGRYKKYGAEMFKLQDRHGRESLLGPTHEETSKCHLLCIKFKQNSVMKIVLVSAFFVVENL